MGKQVESWQSDDGKLFSSQEDMVRHEITVALTEEFPQLKVQIPFIMAKADRFAKIMAKMAPFIKKDHPSGPGKPPAHMGLPVDASGRCHVMQYSDQMICHTCNLTWDTNDSSPPACRKPPSQGSSADTSGRVLPVERFMERRRNRLADAVAEATRDPALGLPAGRDMIGG